MHRSLSIGVALFLPVTALAQAAPTQTPAGDAAVSGSAGSPAAGSPAAGSRAAVASPAELAPEVADTGASATPPPSRPAVASPAELAPEAADTGASATPPPSRPAVAQPTEVVPEVVPGADVIPVTDEIPDAPASDTETSAAGGLARPGSTRPTPGPAVPAPRGFEISFGGYLRLEATTMQPDRFFGVKMPAEYKGDSAPYVGRNDGFVLGGARLNVRAAYEGLYVRLGFDGALANYPDSDSPVGTLSTGLKDAYVRYSFARPLTIWAGRFKPPFDVEELTPSADQFFVHRALESRGVLPHEGAYADLFGQPDTNGFAPGRQLGVMIGSDSAVGSGGLELGYALAVTNGNAGGATLNDNDLPAFWLRIAGKYRAVRRAGDEEGPATYEADQGGTMGLSLFYNEVTTGDLTTRLSNRLLGAGYDIAARIYIVLLQGQILFARNQPLDGDVPATYALGGHAQAAVNIPGTGLYVAYRFAALDPRFRAAESAGEPQQTVDDDLLMHHTAGLTYRCVDLPLVFNVEYTWAVEQGSREMANDRLEAAMQVTF